MKTLVMHQCITVLESDEGFSATPYLCSEDYVTVGYGMKLHNSKGMNPKDFPVVFSREVARLIMGEGILSRYVDLDREITNDGTRPVGWFLHELDDVRQTVLVCMAYQMGVDGVMKFKKMLAALYSLNYPVAAEQMLDSTWAKQTPARAMRYAAMMTTARMHGYYN